MAIFWQCLKYFSPYVSFSPVNEGYNLLFSIFRYKIMHYAMFTGPKTCFTLMCFIFDLNLYNKLFLQLLCCIIWCVRRCMSLSSVKKCFIYVSPVIIIFYWWCPLCCMDHPPYGGDPYVLSFNNKFFGMLN